MRHSTFRVSLVVLLAARVMAQDRAPEFDAVSIKRNLSGSGSSSIGTQRGLAFNMTNVPIIEMVRAGYPATNTEVIGAPDWLRNDRYDVSAKAAGTPTQPEVQAMLRAALKERLKLAAHVEARDTPVYALVVAQPNHAGLTRSTLDCDAIRAARDAAARSGAPPGPPAMGTAPQCGYSWAEVIRAGGITMDMLARMISGISGRVVLDRTGLDGRYEFTLRFGPPTPGAASPDDPPSIFTALQEQLGLKLDATRAPVDTLVIDHVEPPQEN